MRSLLAVALLLASCTAAPGDAGLDLARSPIPDGGDRCSCVVDSDCLSAFPSTWDGLPVSLSCKPRSADGQVCFLPLCAKIDYIVDGGEAAAPWLGVKHCYLGSPAYNAVCIP